MKVARISTPQPARPVDASDSQAADAFLAWLSAAVSPLLAGATPSDEGAQDESTAPSTLVEKATAGEGAASFSVASERRLGPATGLLGDSAGSTASKGGPAAARSPEGNAGPKVGVEDALLFLGAHAAAEGAGELPSVTPNASASFPAARPDVQTPRAETLHVETPHTATLHSATQDEPMHAGPSLGAAQDDVGGGLAAPQNGERGAPNQAGRSPHRQTHASSVHEASVQEGGTQANAGEHAASRHDTAPFPNAKPAPEAQTHAGAQAKGTLAESTTEPAPAQTLRDTPDASDSERLALHPKAEGADTGAATKQSAATKQGASMQAAESQTESTPSGEDLGGEHQNENDESLRFGDAQDGSAREGASAPRSEGGAAPDRAKLLERIARAFPGADARVRTQGDQTLVALRHPSLGNVELQMEFRGDAAYVAARAGGHAAQVLRQSEDSLRRRLRGEGVRLSRFRVADRPSPTRRKRSALDLEA